MSRAVCAGNDRVRKRKAVLRAAAAACCVLFLAAHARAQEPVAKQFLRHLYGAEGIDIARICHPSDDLWMLGGARDSEALDAIEGIRIDTARNGVVSGVVRSTMYFFELRDGLVDASYALDGVYLYHRRLVMEFLYACLAHELESLERMTTDAGKVRILGPAPPSGEMAQYASIIELIPVVRASNPAEDASLHSVTYHVPLGDRGLSLTLVKQAGHWRIDTKKGVLVTLEFFHR